MVVSELASAALELGGVMSSPISATDLKRLARL
jgi:hypothetical protein